MIFKENKVSLLLEGKITGSITVKDQNFLFHQVSHTTDLVQVEEKNNDKENKILINQLRTLFSSIQDFLIKVIASDNGYKLQDNVENY